MEDWEIQNLIHDLRAEMEDKVEDLRREVDELRDRVGAVEDR